MIFALIGSKFSFRKSGLFDRIRSKGGSDSWPREGLWWWYAAASQVTQPELRPRSLYRVRQPTGYNVSHLYELSFSLNAVRNPPE